jgi:hypothetical protein
MRSGYDGGGVFIRVGVISGGTNAAIEGLCPAVEVDLKDEECGSR